jgi:hypothetical protein
LARKTDELLAITAVNLMPFLKNILKIAFVTGVFITTTPSVLACGLIWSSPGAYFEYCDDQGYVLLTEKLADLTIPGESESVPIWMSFTSENRVPSPYAGLWRIGILEMSLVQFGEKQFSMRDPGGNVTLLSWDKNKNILDGPGWKGSITGDRVKLWASCGWSVEFSRGKIAKMNTSRNKSLIFNYTDGFVSSVTCDGKTLIALGSLTENTLDITINGKKLGIVKTDQPCVQRVGKADVLKGTEKSIQEITGRGEEKPRRIYAYPVDEKMRPMITCLGKHESDTFTLTWDRQTRKIVRYNDWEYTKTRDRKERCATLELSRKNSKGEVESYYNDILAGVDITQCGKTKRSEYRFTSGVAKGKVRKIEETVDGKVTHFQKYTYDEKGRPIRGQENDDKLRFEYDDKLRTATAWKNDKLQWQKSMDAKGRIVKVEYPDGKELYLAYTEKSPATAKLIWNQTSIAVQLNTEGLVKAETAIIRGIPK